MGEIVFKGEVYPSDRSVTLKYDDMLTWYSPELEKNIHFKLSIEASKIEVHCETDEYNHTKEFVEIHRRAESLCEAFVNLSSLTAGVHLRFSLLTFSTKDIGQNVQINWKEPALEELQAIHLLLGAGNNDNLVKVISKVDIYPILRDMADAIFERHTTLVNCGRIIERIRNLICSDGNKSKQWAVMRGTLNLSKPFLSFVMDQSQHPRHGGLGKTEKENLEQSLLHTCKVLNRYIYFILGGSKALSTDEYPEL
ncbi:hypothetical protein L9W97_17995 [Vibrio aestuarianus]|uniref:hypothetical protein n=1 Tax=Vibrio aestuarianus TaxID=28171 RepID=UPI00237C7CCE|nr:hypothetical protein [Vibrio aestuarianus]MDE1327022.1 hypothetical protein [Vibrio aestuarianus]